jgi:hypothetical protein
MPVKWEKELLSSGSFFAQKTKKVTGFCSRDFCGIVCFSIQSTPSFTGGIKKL